jgi:hypothetical protein
MSEPRGRLRALFRRDRFERERKREICAEQEA